MPTATFDAQRWEDMLVEIAQELRSAFVKNAAHALAHDNSERYRAINLATALADLYQLDGAIKRLRALPAEDVLELAALFAAARDTGPSDAQNAEINRLMKECFNLDPPSPDSFVGVGPGLAQVQVDGPVNDFTGALARLNAMPVDERTALLAQIRAAFEGLDGTGTVPGTGG